MKPAKKITPETSAAYVGFKDAVRDRAMKEAMAELEKLLRAEIRGLQAKCKLLEDRGKMLEDRVRVLESGSRTPAERYSARFDRIASCGNGGGDAR